MGDRGTAKSVAVRSLADLLPEIDVAGGCTSCCERI
jgi:Mg-chelatase subunit ChlI